MTRLNVYAGPAGFYLVRGGPPAMTSCSTPATAAWPSCPARRQGERQVPARTRPTTRSRSRSRIARSTTTGRCSTRTRARFSTASSGRTSRTAELLADLEPRVLRQHDHGQRQHLAVPGRRAAALPAAFPQRLPVAVPHPGLQRHPRCRGLADRQRGRLPGRAGEHHREPRQPAPDGARRAGRRHRRLHERPVGNYVLGNVGPDEPFGGGEPGDDFPIADPKSTGQVMQFRVVAAATRGPDDTAAVPRAARRSRRCRRRPDAAAGAHREGGSGEDDGRARSRARSRRSSARSIDGLPVEHKWMDPVTENPGVGDTEVWEFYNTTADAHPMHVHEVTFEVVNREGLVMDDEEVALPIPLRAPSRRPSPGRPGSRTRSSPTRARSPASRRRSHTRPVRLALPHRRARGQRDDAAIPHRPGAAWPARMNWKRSSLRATRRSSRDIIMRRRMPVVRAPSGRDQG